MRVLLLLMCLALSIYGLYCAYHMHAFIGTGHYWSNPWFYKAHATLAALIILRMMPAILTRRRRERESRSKP